MAKEPKSHKDTGILRNEYISFIIPALNEEKNISRAIRSIKRCMPESMYEIIVVDNGSSDNTKGVAESEGAKVFVDDTETIGGLRNLGYKQSSGSIIAFIDSDIELSDDWYNNFKVSLRNWPKSQLIVSGSSYLVLENATFIEKNWFAKFPKANITYINSGHMVTTRKMFEVLNGFDRNLKTSEDYDFCQRAKRAGGSIIIDTNLKAYHHGFPKKIKDFIIREAWHGKSDISTIEQFFTSKTAIASLINSVILFFSIFMFFIFKNILPTIFLIVISISICSIFNYMKFGPDKIFDFFKTTLCFEIYLIGRTLSLFLGASRPKARAS